MMYWIILQKNTPLTAVDTDLYWFIMFNLSKMNAYSFHILLVDLFKVECVLCKYMCTSKLVTNTFGSDLILFVAVCPLRYL